MKKDFKVFLVQLGSPKSPSISDVRVYLKEFLGDPRVVDLWRPLWLFILNVFVLRSRPSKSAQAYGRIFDREKGFPLVYLTESLALKMNQFLNSGYQVVARFLIGPNKIIQDIQKADANEALLILSQFPHNSETTTGSVMDQVVMGLKARKTPIDCYLIPHFNRLKIYIDLMASKINEAFAQNPFDELIVSFHGIPLRLVTEKKDAYLTHCVETYVLLSHRLFIEPSKMHIAFQSRFGQEVWTGPNTIDVAKKLVNNGTKKIGVVCPSFTVDCLETIDEIGHELSHELAELGAGVVLIPCLNDDEHFAQAYAGFIDEIIARINDKKILYLPPNKLSHPLVKEIDVADYSYPVLPQEKEKIMSATNAPRVSGAEATSKNSKSIMAIVFLTMFLDLVGFSIIFPMFPAMAKYYLEFDKDNWLLSSVFGFLNSMSSATGNQFNVIVLFGGFLGAFYSLLQFVAAPLWGGLSDKVGRRPILLITIFGMFLSYGLWFFSGSFTLLILARIVGGFMGGNLSVATALVSDVTTKETRSRGMAMVGIAFALGFILGPAIGGMLSTFNLLDYYPDWQASGVNPFSVPALFAAILSFLNFFLVLFKLPETLSAENLHKSFRSANPLELFKPLSNREVNLVNRTYFLFILAFSGMEFTLTFLAVERFNFSPMDNGLMFVYIGVLMALVQGGYVRRRAHSVGEKKMAMIGMMSVIPGLMIIGLASSVFWLYLGLGLLAFGSSLTVPTLTSLVSLLTPAHEQGKGMGTFRSLGSLARVFGPLMASMMYWKLGGTLPYFLGALILVLPLLILMKIKIVR